MTYRLSPLAEADLIGIVEYVEAHDPLAADHLYERFTATFERLAEFPKLGASRSHVRRGLRLLPVGSYLILYRESRGGVVVIRVVHGARRWWNLV